MEKHRNGPALPEGLLKLHRQALVLLTSQDPATALEPLKRSEELLETLTTQGVLVDQDLVLCTLNNLACCYQR